MLPTVVTRSKRRAHNQPGISRCLAELFERPHQCAQRTMGGNLGQAVPTEWHVAFSRALTRAGHRQRPRDWADTRRTTSARTIFESAAAVKTKRAIQSGPWCDSLAPVEPNDAIYTLWHSPGS